ncbi:proteasome-associated protein ECM29 homolog [Centruroides sculpturatus]|uniref:proteasome-associated protein ECM29 homolog n=1 Tax=Centruroides sculpturatus TaxID=218467 RepID=UPI000C6CB4AA|nr:proteasome-associated protein ECM29 homolog [Centruroides sculpturatus]
MSADMELLERLLSEILQKYIIHTKTSVRQASCVWLLTLLKQCGNQQVMKIQLATIQNSLMNLLADSNDIIQDIAAKGLSMIYEFGDGESQQKLLTKLVDTLTSGRKSSITVTEETKLFNEGLLGNSPTGGGLSTYKELCAVASDLNQPELIYKFMHLANHNALWNSKKGAAFGFGIIAQQAKSQLKEYLPIIVPKLYRYQFDPNSSVRLSFVSIWHAVVPDEQKVIDQYLEEIIKDIDYNLTSPQWRIRESCCLALSDLLRGRDVEKIIDYFPDLWEKCFRLRDDIKETVRNAASSTLKTLSKICIKFCDVNLGKSSEKMLTTILPVLVKSGLMSSLAEIREISLSTIVQISKKAGHLLKPHLPLLFIALLEALSINEPNVINYLSNRLDESNQEKLDIQRVSVFQKSPMMETINFCVQYIDDDILKELVPRLTDLIRNSVALGTKSGCANFIITLTLQCPQELQQYSGKLLSALISGLNDRNGAVRRSYAKAIGHLVRVSKESSVNKVIGKIQVWYLEKEEDYVHTSCVYTMHSIALHSPDIFRRHLTEALPLVFFAMHGKSSKENEDLQSLWKEMWLEFTTSKFYNKRLKLFNFKLNKMK